MLPRTRWRIGRPGGRKAGAVTGRKVWPQDIAAPLAQYRFTVAVDRPQCVAVAVMLAPCLSRHAATWAAS
jgi:hypothetical protein